MTSAPVASTVAAVSSTPDMTSSLRARDREGGSLPPPSAPSLPAGERGKPDDTSNAGKSATPPGGDGSTPRANRVDGKCRMPGWSIRTGRRIRHAINDDAIYGRAEGRHIADFDPRFKSRGPSFTGRTAKWMASPAYRIVA